jgi:peptidoglycan/LPS O-acetylase OafA/YrhL
MLNPLRLLPALVATAGVSLSLSALAQPVDQKLGKVHFEAWFGIRHFWVTRASGSRRPPRGSVAAFRH